jgi:hypothetical protein
MKNGGYRDAQIMVVLKQGGPVTELFRSFDLVFWHKGEV